MVMIKQQGFMIGFVFTVGFDKLKLLLFFVFSFFL